VKKRIARATADAPFAPGVAKIVDELDLPAEPRNASGQLNFPVDVIEEAGDRWLVAGYGPSN
jgi:hypothetical protein